MARKKTVITKKAEIRGNVSALLVNPEFKGPVQFGDKYVQAEAKLRETHGLYGVPELPRAFTPRPEELTPIKTALLSGETSRVGITGKALRVGLQGMGGIGKTTLAIALARDSDLQNQFPQGIFWISLGQQPDILSAQGNLANLLETTNHAFTNSSDGRNQLEWLLRGRRCLLILDDIWQAEHAEPFNGLDAQAQACLLITSRNQEIINRLDAHLHTLDVLTSEQALALLAQWTNTKVQLLPDEAQQVAAECGNLPLALAMVGAMAKQRSWRHALERLHRTDFDRIETAFPYAYPNLLLALQASLDDLEDSETLSKLNARMHYLELAIFPEDTQIPIPTLRTLWMSGPDSLDDLDFEDLLIGLENRALIQHDTEGRVSLHDLQRDFIVNVAKQEKPLVERQAAFLEAYRSKTREGLWHTLSDDGYIYQYLAWHLIEAGEPDELRKILLDFRWLRTKLEKTNFGSMLRDYDLALRDPVSLSKVMIYALSIVRDSLYFSAHVVVQDKSQLAGQLLGRMLSFREPEIQVFLEDIKKNIRSNLPWLNPLIASLKPPGGAEILTLTGHSSPIRAVALTPDGRLAVSGSWDNHLKVWDLTRPEAEPRTLSGSGEVTAIALTPDGRLAVSASWDDYTLKVWDLTQPEAEPSTLQGHSSWVYAIALTPNGRLAVSGSADRTLKVWDLTQPEAEPRTLSGHSGSVFAVALTPDGRLAVSGADDHTLRVWDLTQPELKPRTLSGHPNLVKAVVLAPDGRMAVSASYDNTIIFWDLSRQRARQRTIHYGRSDMVDFTVTNQDGQIVDPGSGVTAVALTPDGRLAITGSRDNTLKVWDLTRPRAKPRTLQGHVKEVQAIALTPDGRLAISGSDDHTLKVWDLTRPDAEPVTPSWHSRQVSAVALTPDGRLAVSGSWDSTVKVWDLTHPEAKPRTFSGHSRSVFAVALTPDGRLAVSGSQGGTIKVWDPTRPEAKPRTLQGHTGMVHAVVLTPDGHLAVSGSADMTLKVWDLTQSEVRSRTLSKDSFVTAIALTSDGRRLVSGFVNNILKVWDLSQPKAKPRILSGHFAPVSAVALTADGRMAISGSWDETIKVWKLTGPEVRPDTLIHKGRVIAIAMTPDGRLAISGSTHHILQVWDLARARVKPRTIKGYSGEAHALALSPDGRLAVFGSLDNTLKVWDIRNNRLLSSFTGESKFVEVSISDDGRAIFAGGVLGEIYILQLEGMETISQGGSKQV